MFYQRNEVLLPFLAGGVWIVQKCYSYSVDSWCGGARYPSQEPYARSRPFWPQSPEGHLLAMRQCPLPRFSGLEPPLANMWVGG